MSKKHIVVQGATCTCKYSNESQDDVLKVKTQSKHYTNDKEGTEKLTASTKEIGQTLEKNTFGTCKMQPNPSGTYNPCLVNITEWKNFYDKITLSNDGKVLVEDSKATCKMGTPDCITILDHGQIAELSAQNFKNENRDVLNKINPLLGLNDLTKPEFDFTGIEQK
ncbi:DUF4280 domain-containing protein [Flavobacterium branchiarum]|uniref:DUF4280 domain-containing protein n=1 Tax=Flavobacterium branchiarum TaxID=1114870 RepID=A0ABV5FS92_9FLAO|nr:DUF4280 domain-containing protein [Flavobacterium branchiarum]MDN3673505.1 DUF4280 domain-containing protein [Flavobacterium branchiarum]